MWRYLHHAHHFPHWEMTDSEILAGIDGIFLAQKVAIWMNDPVRLRLSQAIDMYYSDRGLPYLKIENSGTDSATVRESPKANTEASHTTDALATSTHSIQNGDDITNACSRPRILDSIDRKKLQDQTYAISQVLQYSTSSVAIADKVLRTNCNAVVDKFFRHSSEFRNFYLRGFSTNWRRKIQYSPFRSGNLLRAQPSCRGVYHTPLKVPVVDLTLITDGSRDRFATLELISFLAETIGISKFGSYLTVIDGKAGNRIVGRTQSIADVFQQLQFFTEHGPFLFSVIQLCMHCMPTETFAPFIPQRRTISNYPAHLPHIWKWCQYKCETNEWTVLLLAHHTSYWSFVKVRRSLKTIFLNRVACFAQHLRNFPICLSYSSSTMSTWQRICSSNQEHTVNNVTVNTLSL